MTANRGKSLPQSQLCLPRFYGEHSPGANSSVIFPPSLHSITTSASKLEYKDLEQSILKVYLRPVNSRPFPKGG
jgi:hypothetical protein